MTGDSNTGHRNTGDSNAGYFNTGDCSTGHSNTGHFNAGNRNTGDFNTGDRNTGYFNTITPNGGYFFNKWLSFDDWNEARMPNWIFVPRPATWIAKDEMTDFEKTANPTFYTCGGYLRTNDMMEEYRIAFNNATPEDIELTRRLPNFDAEVFKEITGIDLSEKDDCAGKTVTVDGKEYRLVPT
jgi:hypothetical protein